MFICRQSLQKKSFILKVYFCYTVLDINQKWSPCQGWTPVAFFVLGLVFSQRHLDVAYHGRFQTIVCDVVASSAELSDCNTYVDGSALDVPWVGHPGDILMRQTAPSAKSLTGWGKKRLCSLMVRQRILLYLFSRWQQWWMLSFSILWNL